MIQFSEKTNYEYRKGSKVIKKCKKQLEEALRLLGNFKKDESIIIINYQPGEEYDDEIYEIKDQDDTSFKFLNFRPEHIDDNRFRKNYQLIMKRQNSNFTYKYDFFRLDHYDYCQVLRLIEINYALTENKIITLKRKKHQPINLILEEDNKKYIIGFYDSAEENDTKLLQDFDIMVEKAKLITNLNLETTLGIISNYRKISFAYIYKNDKMIANVSFVNGNISKYEINELTRKIEVVLNTKITRTTERNLDGQRVSYSKEIIKGDYEKIQLESKKLLKEL